MPASSELQLSDDLQKQAEGFFLLKKYTLLLVEVHLKIESGDTTRPNSLRKYSRLTTERSTCISHTGSSTTWSVSTCGIDQPLLSEYSSSRRVSVTDCLEICVLELDIMQPHEH